MTQPGGRCEAMGRYSAFLKGVPQVWSAVVKYPQPWL